MELQEYFTFFPDLRRTKNALGCSCFKSAPSIYVVSLCTVRRAGDDGTARVASWDLVMTWTSLRDLALD